MQAVSDADGNLKYMLGDFKDTYVNSAEDAQVILEVYKSQFTDEDIQFKFVDITQLYLLLHYLIHPTVSWYYLNPTQLYTLYLLNYKMLVY